MQETPVQPLVWEGPLEKGMATQPNILPWRIPWTEEPSGLYSPWSCKESDTVEEDLKILQFKILHIKLKKK